MASDRTWIASYHLRGAAQTWYYALEQDEGGMPPWERFPDLCLLWFGLPYSAELFVGGLPDLIRADVEMRDPQDLQTAMYYVGAYEQCANAMQQAFQGRGARTPTRPAPVAATPTRPALSTATAAAPASTRTFWRLTSAEQLERRCKGLCFNCDAPYAPGHTCARLFYLETVDDAEVEALTVELDTTTLSEAGVTTYGPVDATAFAVSLHAMAGIKTAKTMLLPVTINGERLTALVDTGLTHNFLSRDAMRRLALQPAGAEKFSVTIANGDRLTCHGVARQVPVLIGNDPFSINCVGIDIGCYDFILGIDFLSTLGPILWDLDRAVPHLLARGGRRVKWTGIGGSGAATPQLQLLAVALDEAHPLLADLLQQHNDIFDERQGLPPARTCDHRIHLLPDTAHVTVHPYRYLHLQKDELER
uniref:Uncharacterized protein n=1 Tax=Avena sativa TaxID=4498 RepID=A0ACD5X5F1_AVESA